MGVARKKSEMASTQLLSWLIAQNHLRNYFIESMCWCATIFLHYWIGESFCLCNTGACYSSVSRESSPHLLVSFVQSYLILSYLAYFFKLWTGIKYNSIIIFMCIIHAINIKRSYKQVTHAKWCAAFEQHFC